MSKKHDEQYGNVDRSQVEKHRPLKERKRKKRYREIERKGENELRKRKIKEKEEKTTGHDATVTLNEFSNQLESNKGSREIDGNEVTEKMWKKRKKRYLENAVEAGFDFEKQHKKARLDPLVVSKNKEHKKKRKHTSPPGTPDKIDLKRAKYKSQLHGESKDKCHQMHQMKYSLSSHGESENAHAYHEPSELEKSGSVCSARNGGKKKKKKKDKEKNRKKKTQSVSLANVSDCNVLDGNADNEKIETSPAHVYKDKEKCSYRKQSKGSSSCKQLHKSKQIYFEQDASEISGDANSFLENSNDLEVRTKRDRKHKKRKEKESNKSGQEFSMRKETNLVFNDCALDGKEVTTCSSRADLAENVGKLGNNKKQKKKKKKRQKEKGSEGRHKLTMVERPKCVNDNKHDGKEMLNSRAEMAENVQKPEDEEKLREAMVHADAIHETFALSKKQLQDLKQKGIKVKKGKWSFQEINLLTSNMERLLETYQLPDPVRILVRSSTDKEEGKFWRRFACENDFYKQLGRGIVRPLDAIYRCALRIYDNSNYIGKYSEEEVEELRRLNAVHGTDWVTIGQLLGRSRMSVNRKYSKLPATAGGGGTWRDDEEKRLREAVYLVTNTTEDQPVPTDGIYWPPVAQIVKTRNAEQCRRKWLERLCWMKDDERKKWTKQNELKLIKSLYKSGVTQECDVDWMEVKSTFSSFSNYPPQWLRTKWSVVKRKAPNYHQMEFEDIVDYLYHVYGKTLRAQLKAETSTSRPDSS